MSGRRDTIKLVEVFKKWIGYQLPIIGLAIAETLFESGHKFHPTLNHEMEIPFSRLRVGDRFSFDPRFEALHVSYIETTMGKKEIVGTFTNCGGRFVRMPPNKIVYVDFATFGDRI